jgi:hypothetical protein
MAVTIGGHLAQATHREPPHDDGDYRGAERTDQPPADRWPRLAALRGPERPWRLGRKRAHEMRRARHGLTDQVADGPLAAPERLRQTAAVRTGVVSVTRAQTYRERRAREVGIDTRPAGPPAGPHEPEKGDGAGHDGTGSGSRLVSARARGGSRRDHRPPESPDRALSLPLPTCRCPPENVSLPPLIRRFHPSLGVPPRQTPRHVAATSMLAIQRGFRPPRESLARVVGLGALEGIGRPRRRGSRSRRRGVPWPVRRVSRTGRAWAVMWSSGDASTGRPRCWRDAHHAECRAGAGGAGGRVVRVAGCRAERAVVVGGCW